MERVHEARAAVVRAVGLDMSALRAAVAALAFTLLDAAATYVWLVHGVAVEANPVMRELIAALGAAGALLVRVSIGIALVVALAALVRRSRFARCALYAVATVLGAVGVWHIHGVTLMVGG